LEFSSISRKIGLTCSENAIAILIGGITDRKDGKAAAPRCRTVVPVE
jgi:hypothetical protein